MPGRQSIPWNPWRGSSRSGSDTLSVAGYAGKLCYKTPWMQGGVRMRRAAHSGIKRNVLRGGASGRASSFGVGSLLSIGSVGSYLSVLSIGSAGSILSIGSSGSILCIGSAGAILRIGVARRTKRTNRKVRETVWQPRLNPPRRSPTLSGARSGLDGRSSGGPSSRPRPTSGTSPGW
jgi:hypothetical protein